MWSSGRATVPPPFPSEITDGCDSTAARQAGADRSGAPRKPSTLSRCTHEDTELPDHRLQPGRNFVTLKIETDQGVYGIGDATLNGRELAVAAYLTEHVVPALIGRDPARIEDIWQYLYRGAYWRRGPVTMSAIAAVDTALWDIKGKMAFHAAVRSARRQEPRRGDGLRTRQRHGHRRDARRSRALHRSRLQGDPRAVGHPGAIVDVRRFQGPPVLRAGRCGDPRPRMCGRRRSTWTTRRGCSRRSARAFGFDHHLLHDVHHRSRRSRPGGWGRRSSRIGCSGWKIPRRPRIRKASA